MKRLVIVVAVVFAACAENPPSQDMTTSVQWQKVSWSGSVARVTVDGVDCVIYDDSESGGIDCDWKEG